MYKVLVVDDQQDILEAMRLLLKGGGYAAQTATSPEQALQAAAAGDHDLILIDMNYARDTTSGTEGLALLEMLHTQWPEIPVVVMTAWSTIDLAVDAMRRGASDFITKPWDNERVLELVARQTARQTRRGYDASVARRVQQRLLPRPHMALAGFEYDCVFRPAGDIGGDLCDVFETGSGPVAFLLGDVSGKGTGAAMLMAHLHGVIHSHTDLMNEPGRLLGRVNQQFFEATPAEHYASLFFGLFDPATRGLRYVNCGHPPAVLLRASGKVERLEATAVMLGAFEEACFEERTLILAPGDRLVIFSDGISEARDSEGDGWVIESIRMLGRAGSRSLAQSLARPRPTHPALPMMLRSSTCDSDA